MPHSPWGPTPVDIQSVAAAVAALVAVLSFIHSLRASKSADASAKASQESAKVAAEMLAQDRHEYELRLKPLMVVRIGTEPHPNRAMGVSVLYVENRGPGTATDVHAELLLRCNDADTPDKWSPQWSALRPGDKEKMPGGSLRGRVDVWGEITCQDMEGRRYTFTCEQGSNIWNEASPDLRASD